MVKLGGQNYIVFVRGPKLLRWKHRGPKVRLSQKLNSEQKNK